MSSPITCPECAGILTTNRTALEPGKHLNCPHCDAWFDVRRSPFDYLNKFFIVLCTLQIVRVGVELWNGELQWANVLGAAAMIVIVVYSHVRFAHMGVTLRKEEPPAAELELARARGD